MPHILVAGKLHPAGLERLKKAEGFTSTLVQEVSVESYVPHLNAVLGDKWFGVVMFLVGVIGIALRFATSTPIVKPKKGDPDGIVSRT